MVRKVGFILTLFVTSLLFADARVTQKTQVQFGGALGGVVNVFGGKAAREGITSDVSVKKNRRSSGYFRASSGQMYIRSLKTHFQRPT